VFVGVLSAAVRDYRENYWIFTETEEKTTGPNCGHADRRLAAPYTVFSLSTLTNEVLNISAGKAAKAQCNECMTGPVLLSSRDLTAE